MADWAQVWSHGRQRSCWLGLGWRIVICSQLEDSKCELLGSMGLTRDIGDFDRQGAVNWGYVRWKCQWCGWDSLGNGFKHMHGVQDGSTWRTDDSNHGFKGSQENRWEVGQMRVCRCKPR